MVTLKERYAKSISLVPEKKVGSPLRDATQSFIQCGHVRSVA